MQQSADVCPFVCHTLVGLLYQKEQS